MNYKFLRALSPLLCLCFCFAQCKKTSSTQEDQLPPATQTGANTFGCLVNGTAFTPSVPLPLDKSTLSMVYDQGYKNGTINIYADNKNSDVNTSIGFSSSGINDIGTYTTGFYTRYNSKYNLFIGYANAISGCAIGVTDSPYNPIDTGLLTITKFDKINRVFAGTFSATMYSTTCDTIKITNGRFDLKF